MTGALTPPLGTRPPLGTQSASAGPDGAAAGGARGLRHGSRSGNAGRGTPRSTDQIVPAQAPLAQTLPWPSAARTHHHSRAGPMPVLRLDETVEAWRGRHRNPGSDPTAMEGHPDGAGEVLLPGL